MASDWVFSSPGGAAAASKVAEEQKGLRAELCSPLVSTPQQQAPALDQLPASGLGSHHRLVGRGEGPGAGWIINKPPLQDVKCSGESHSPAGSRPPEPLCRCCTCRRLRKYVQPFPALEGRHGGPGREGNATHAIVHPANNMGLFVARAFPAVASRGCCVLGSGLAGYGGMGPWHPIPSHPPPPPSCQGLCSEAGTCLLFPPSCS